MKRLIILFFSVFISFSTFASTEWMYCNGRGLAVIFQTDDNGDPIANSYHAAGACAGGPWVVRLQIAPPQGGCDLVICDEYATSQINENLVPGEVATPSEDDLDEIDSILESNESFSTVYLNPDDLDPDIYQFLKDYIAE
ncbi:hypothetical protein [Salibacter sp.]|uniref:hypothetical protein n=1 Tax=Salibacter sp. TaxID=2010995 RepID=UPI002870394C|nr:hypothetical protein [Salibacter sp.]MDR9488037.1 hypothetical protein [Salibacter sp.]